MPSMLPWMDRFEGAPLHPCSMETIPVPVTLPDGTSVWPVMLSCYQLDQPSPQQSAVVSVEDDADDDRQIDWKEEEEEDFDDDKNQEADDDADTDNYYNGQRKSGSQRSGSLQLFFVQVPDIAGSLDSSLPLRFGTPLSLVDPSSSRQRVHQGPPSSPFLWSSGVLDGQWCRMPTEGSDRAWCFASAHSNGEVRLHTLVIPPARPSDYPMLDSDPLYQVRSMEGGNGAPTSTMANEEDQFVGTAVPPLCLSVRWESSCPYRDEPTPITRLVSTYSNGTVAIHNVVFFTHQGESTEEAMHNNDMDDPYQVQMIETDRWMAHSMYTSPAEVWSACFVRFGDGHVVMSGGDEGRLKIWDVRATYRPCQVVQPFEAGVTCLSPHPQLDHLVACGSYDETICLLDVRYPRIPLYHSSKLGGGVWRLKWHPYSKHRLLVAAMHGGCRVVQWYGLPDELVSPEETEPASVYNSSVRSVKAKVTKKFTEHESMAYGADWLCCPHPTQNGHFEAAASCSFYDRAVFLWDSVL